jgi:type II secretory pathway component HofQ
VSSLIVILTLASVLSAASATAAESGLKKRVDVEVRHAPLSTFLDSISEQTKINFILAEDLADEKVTAFLHGVTVEEALGVLREIKGVDYKRIIRSGAFLVAPKDSPLLSESPALTGAKDLDARVSIRVKNAPLDQFLASLAAQTKLNFVLADGLENTTVTAFLQDVTAREALEIVLAVKGLTCRRLEEQKTYALAPVRPSAAR